jgi:hypothetical protein
MLRRLKRFADTERDLPGIGFTRPADDIFEPGIRK